jgi:hypothetical protein
MMNKISVICLASCLIGCGGPDVVGELKVHYTNDRQPLITFYDDCLTLPNHVPIVKWNGWTGTYKITCYNNGSLWKEGE